MIEKTYQMNKTYQIRKAWAVYLFLLLALLCLGGCGKHLDTFDPLTCQVVLESGQGYITESPVIQTEREGDVSVLIQLESGYLLTGTSYEDYTATHEKEGIRLVFRDVKYSTVIRLYTQKSDLSICYYANGGELISQSSTSDHVISSRDEDPYVELAVLPAHLRINTSIGTDMFIRDGYTLTGWNTCADGSGIPIGLGSRTAVSGRLKLYAQWSRWSDPACFQYKEEGDHIIITGYTGSDTTITIPASIQGLPVIQIAKDAFREQECDIVICPLSLQTIEDGAFRGCRLQELYLYDNISKLDDYSFEDCGKLTTLHINAVEAPVYSGSYFDTFQDKYDRLLSLANQKKIVLFSGSSTRFGYDSALLEEAFPEYQVVNMGAFAYSNALPQMMLILGCMREGDILIDAPEFDAAIRQFCTSKELDPACFSMMESDYDTFAQLDLTKFQKVFYSLYSYLSTKEKMDPLSYDLAASQFDEAGDPVSTPSYNKYGDYILYRPNAVSDQPIYGLAVDYTVEAFPKERYIDSINQVYQLFLDEGVHVYFTFAPRNKLALSENSTLEARNELQEYLKNQLVVPVISPLEDSLYSGTYMYGTDNHLSTEGVEIRTNRVIRDLTQQLNREEAVNK